MCWATICAYLADQKLTTCLPTFRMHLSPLWRTALLSASRDLRQNILKGNIWADSSPPSTGGEYSEVFDPFKYPDTSSASSSNLDFASNSNVPNGLSEKGIKRYQTLGRSTKKARGGGRVKGMVENWERSGSESEGGEADIFDPPRPPSVPQSSALASVSSPTSPSSDYMTPPSTPSSLSFADREGPFSAYLGKDEMQMGGQPTIEALLSSSDYTLGASAREEIDASAGLITVKRVPDIETAPQVSDSTAKKQEEGEDEFKAVVGWEDGDSFESRRLDALPFTVEPSPILASDSDSADETLGGSKRASVGLGLGRPGKRNEDERDERRIVTAIFSAEPDPQHVSEPDVASNAETNSESFEAAAALEDVLPSEVASSSLESAEELMRLQEGDESVKIDYEHADGAAIARQANEEIERALARAQALAAAEAEIAKVAAKLEASLADNRPLLEAYGRRLDEVERNIAEKEEQQRKREEIYGFIGLCAATVVLGFALIRFLKRI